MKILKKDISQQNKLKTAKDTLGTKKQKKLSQDDVEIKLQRENKTDESKKYMKV